MQNRQTFYHYRPSQVKYTATGIHDTPFYMAWHIIIDFYREGDKYFSFKVRHSSVKLFRSIMPVDHKNCGRIWTRFSFRIYPIC